jgi:uridine kinase
LLLELGGEENVNYVLHDSYYKDQSHKSLEERALTNFDHPDSLDTDLLIQHVRQLKRGETVQIPTYDFVTHSRTPTTITLAPAKIILVEGILIFSHPQLLAELDIRVYVDAEADIRFIRRLQRDVSERGRTVDDVVSQYHATVRPMHNVHVEPTKLLADLVVNSTTHSMNVAIDMLVNHVKLKTGVSVGVTSDDDDNETGAIKADGRSVLERGVSYDPVSDSFSEEGTSNHGAAAITSQKTDSLHDIAEESTKS